MDKALFTEFQVLTTHTKTYEIDFCLEMILSQKCESDVLNPGYLYREGHI
jgi:hypothetical protein